DAVHYFGVRGRQVRSDFGGDDVRRRHEDLVELVQFAPRLNAGDGSVSRRDALNGCAEVDGDAFRAEGIRERLVIRLERALQVAEGFLRPCTLPRRKPQEDLV